MLRYHVRVKRGKVFRPLAEIATNFIPIANIPTFEIVSDTRRLGARHVNDQGTLFPSSLEFGDNSVKSGILAIIQYKDPVSMGGVVLRSSCNKGVHDYVRIFAATRNRDING